MTALPVSDDNPVLPPPATGDDAEEVSVPRDSVRQVVGEVLNEFLQTSGSGVSLPAASVATPER